MRTALTMEWPAFLESGPTDERALFQRDMLESLHTATDPMMSSVKSETAQSIASHYSVEDRVSADGVEIAIENDSPIYNLWEEDTKPHDIFPVHSSVLAFPVGGQIVFARVVHHPGTKGHHVFKTEYQRAQPSIQRAIQAGLNAYMLDSLGNRSAR